MIMINNNFKNKYKGTKFLIIKISKIIFKMRIKISLLNLIKLKIKIQTIFLINFKMKTKIIFIMVHKINNNIK